MPNPTQTQGQDKELERFHPSYCDKYEILRGIYPNDRRETGEACSCGFDTAVNSEVNKVLREVDQRLSVVHDDALNIVNEYIEKGGIRPSTHGAVRIGVEKAKEATAAVRQQYPVKEKS